jgi:hypothetical protein
VDAGPEEPRLEGYIGFYTDQGMERPEYKNGNSGPTIIILPFSMTMLSIWIMAH